MQESIFDMAQLLQGMKYDLKCKYMLIPSVVDEYFREALAECAVRKAIGE